jgi:hypothetical protein
VVDICCWSLSLLFVAFFIFVDDPRKNKNNSRLSGQPNIQAHTHLSKDILTQLMTFLTRDKNPCSIAGVDGLFVKISAPKTGGSSRPQHQRRPPPPYAAHVVEAEQHVLNGGCEPRVTRPVEAPGVATNRE